MPTLQVIGTENGTFITMSSLLKSMIPECRVVEAPAGSSPVEWAKTSKTDTILFGIDRTVEKSLEHCREVTADPETKNVPVVALTSAEKNLF